MMKRELPLGTSSFILRYSSFCVRPRGAVRSARLPVTQEIAGSNPVEGAFDSSGAVRKPAKRRSSNLRDLRVRLPPAPLRTCVGWASACPTACKAASPQGYAGSTPARRTFNMARSSIGEGHRPLTPERRVRFPHGLLSMTKWRNWKTRDAQNVVPQGMGVRISPWSLLVTWLVVRHFPAVSTAKPGSLHSPLPHSRPGNQKALQARQVPNWLP